MTIVPGAPKLISICLTAALGGSQYACGQGTANAETPLVTEEPTVLQGHLHPSIEATSSDDQDDAELRRGYGAVDMRLHPCVAPQGESGLRGEGCSPGFVIYGPYVTVPANASIEIMFDVLSSQELEVYADIVSQMGKQELAGLSPQVLKPGITHRIGYRVTTFRSDPYVESRVGFRASTPVQFLITNYTMSVR